jgi:hypothetical protein
VCLRRSRSKVSGIQLTPAEKTACYVDLAARNKAQYKEDKRDWEAEQVPHRLHATRAHPGRKAEFKHTRATSAFTLEEGKGGINWYWYQEKILKPLQCLLLRN